MFKMKRQWKRIISTIMAALMVVTVIPSSFGSSSAAEIATPGDADPADDTTDTTTDDGDEEDGDYDIPDPDDNNGNTLYMVEQLTCQIEIAKYNEELAKINYNTTVNPLIAKRDKLNKNNDGKGNISVYAESDGVVQSVYASQGKQIKEGDKVSGEDCREGLTAVISVKLTDAQFEGQTKAKLGNASMRTLVDAIVSDKLMQFLDENPVVARTILDKAMMANRAREAARKARESIRRKSALGGAAMPDKLRDCNENNPELTEIYIVEGDSAGGSATQGRDSRFQAILPLWGKMLNVEKVRADKIYGNDKLQPVIVALGAGLGEDFDVNKLRYHKVIIMADADVDGSHIRTLLLTFFFRYMRPLIENGYVYAAVPPLFKLVRGKTTRLAFSEEERDKYSAELRGDNPNAKVDISRFKGLGEMNPHELWETTMDPEKRTLKRITLEDAVLADETFTVLMGEKVEPRKEFIEQNAKYAVNLDF